jgi:hypothetical protein
MSFFLMKQRNNDDLPMLLLFSVYLHMNIFKLMNNQRSQVLFSNRKISWIINNEKLIVQKTVNSNRQFKTEGN